jgi:hypothetical protein
MTHDLGSVALTLVADWKGILAADEGLERTSAEHRISWTFLHSLYAREAESELGTLATDKYLRHSRRAENHYAA